MLQDTSIAIHPGNTKDQKHFGYKDIGNVVEFEKHKDEVHLRCQFGEVGVRFYQDEIVRIVMSSSTLSWETSPAVVLKADPKKVSIEDKEIGRAHV
jgi:alpha-glucosidase